MRKYPAKKVAFKRGIHYFSKVVPRCHALFKPKQAQSNMKLAISILFSLLMLQAGAAIAQTVTITVYNHAAGDGPADLASGGIPLHQGALLNEGFITLQDGGAAIPIAVKVLARWHPDNSIRSLLIQFNADFPGETKTYALNIGDMRLTSDSLTPVTWDFPKKIITLPADYLCSSQVVWEQEPLGTTNHPGWEQKQTGYYSKIDYESVTLNDCAGTDQYYNSIHSSYQLYVRTGDKQYLINGRKWALHHARDQIYLDGDRIGRGKCTLWDGGTRYTYIQGLVDDYFLWGNDESKNVAGIIADHFYMTHSDTFYYLAPGERWEHWNERDPAFALLGLVTYYEATNDISYLDKAQERIDLLAQMQSANGETAWIHNLHDHDPDYSECADAGSWGISPWMTGILLEGIIKYHKLTSDYMARQSIFWALDYLMNHCIASGDYAGESFVYLCGCSNPSYRDGKPDLDNMISHAFAYGYKISGRIDYKNLALDLFNTSVDHGYIGSAKHYNQQFRTSGHTVAYLAGPVSATGAAIPEAMIELFQNYPNPFNPRTTIFYRIRDAGPVKLGIYDIRGRLIRTIVQRHQSAGIHVDTWGGRTESGLMAPSGIYFIRLEAMSEVKTKKILLLK
jgi:hypothetical protein